MDGKWLELNRFFILLIFFLVFNIRLWCYPFSLLLSFTFVSWYSFILLLFLIGFIYSVAQALNLTHGHPAFAWLRLLPFGRTLLRLGGTHTSDHWLCPVEAPITMSDMSATHGGVCGLPWLLWDALAIIQLVLIFVFVAIDDVTSVDVVRFSLFSVDRNGLLFDRLCKMVGATGVGVWISLELGVWSLRGLFC